MHHLDDNQWNEDDVADMLQSKIPQDFHKAMVEHYRDRVQQVISKGLQYTKQYFFVRNSLKQHQKLLQQKPKFY